MTQTLPRPRVATESGAGATSPASSSGSRSAKEPTVGSVWVRGAFAALSCAAVGAASLMVIVLGVWAADARSGASAGSAIRVALDFWLVGHRIPVHVQGASVALAPLGLTFLICLSLSRATAIVARGSRCASFSDLALVVAAVTLPYAVIVTGCSIAARTPTAHTSPVTALAAGLLIGTLAGAVGALHGVGLIGAAWRLLPEQVRQGARAAGGALVVLGAVSVVLVLVAVGDHLGSMQRVLRSDGGISAQLAVGVMCILLAPNLVGFGLGYAVGPGFALGAGTSVSFTGASLGQLPAFPLVAAAPHGTSAPMTALCVFGFLGAGATTGVLIVRSPARNLVAQLEYAAIAAALAGIATLLVTALSGGPVGPGRMAAIGPSPWRCGLAISLEVGVTALLVVLVWSWVRLARELVAGAARS